MLILGGQNQHSNGNYLERKLISLSEAPWRWTEVNTLSLLRFLRRPGWIPFTWRAYFPLEFRKDFKKEEEQVLTLNFRENRLRLPRLSELPPWNGLLVSGLSGVMALWWRAEAARPASGAATGTPQPSRASHSLEECEGFRWRFSRQSRWSSIIPAPWWPCKDRPADSVSLSVHPLGCLRRGLSMQTAQQGIRRKYKLRFSNNPCPKA